MKKGLFAIVMTLSLMLGVAHAADQDGDGVVDDRDNCPLVANQSQLDNNFNKIGDTCEGDWDHDRVPDDRDNCWDQANENQADLDGDGVGDVCDNDRDGDGYTNDFETGSLHTDPDNWDTDGDHVADRFDCDKINTAKAFQIDCSTTYQITDAPPSGFSPDVSALDSDDDDDGILDDQDNCPLAFNPSQTDQDGDGRGDACDNITSGVNDLVFAKGGGGGFRGANCSLAAPSVQSPSWEVMALLAFPSLILWGLRLRTWKNLR